MVKLNTWLWCGNTLTSEKYLKSINGISISPNPFCIIKIWNNNSKINDIKIINNIDKIIVKVFTRLTKIDHIKYILVQGIVLFLPEAKQCI